MPAQHARGYAFGEAELKDALGVLGFDRDPLVDLLAVVLAGELFEKGGGRELLFIADDDALVGARAGAERIDRLDLARFVHPPDIELQSAGLEEPSNSERAHHDDGFEILDRGYRLLAQEPERALDA